MDSNPQTLTKHIMEEERRFPDASGSLTSCLASIQLACKTISSAVTRAGMRNLAGVAGSVNVQGEDQKKLDILSNDIFINSLRWSGQAAAMVSEENEDILPGDADGNYVLVFDPLDGSSNIEASVSVGTIFGVYKKTDDPSPEAWALQPGHAMAAAGYCMYGSSTVLVLSTGNGVNGFTLDPEIGEFILTHKNIRIPEKGNVYSINEGNASFWSKGITEYVASKKFPADGAKPYSLRYIGSMVADVHRTLLYGGIFLYPGDSKSPKGKLRILYEGFPMSFICEQAGGKAIWEGGRVLDVKPTSIHERCPIVLGSAQDVADAAASLAKHDS